MNTPSLFTFGYEGMTIEAFIKRLIDARVSLIVDVRERPISRKPGFSSRTFRDHLASAGVGYMHEPVLGCPKQVREKYRNDGDWAEYTRGFLAHLDSVTTEIRKLVTTSRENRVCLVCFEEDFSGCHRTYVARAVAAAGGPAVRHLTAGSVVTDTA